MSVTSIVASGSHQASVRGRKTPAQNTRAYAALKLFGNSPGHRVTANTAMSKTASQRLDFWFTAPNDKASIDVGKATARQGASLRCSCDREVAGICCAERTRF